MFFISLLNSHFHGFMFCLLYDCFVFSFWFFFWSVYIIRLLFLIGLLNFDLCKWLFFTFGYFYCRRLVFWLGVMVVGDFTKNNNLRFLKKSIKGSIRPVEGDIRLVKWSRQTVKSEREVSYGPLKKTYNFLRLLE